MHHFNEGDKSPHIDPALEIAVTGDFADADTVNVRVISTSLPIMGFQAIYLATGVGV